jgi:hypothetical protein
VLAFKALQTQWDVVVAGDSVVYKGLNYGGLKAALVIVGAKKKQAQEIYLGLQIMEAAAIEVLNEKKDAE